MNTDDENDVATKRKYEAGGFEVGLLDIRAQLPGLIRSQIIFVFAMNEYPSY